MEHCSALLTAVVVACGMGNAAIIVSGTKYSVASILRKHDLRASTGADAVRNGSYNSIMRRSYPHHCKYAF